MNIATNTEKIKFNSYGSYTGDRSNATPLYSYLSRDMSLRASQINFLNSNSTDSLKWASNNTGINNSIIGTNMNNYEVVKTVHDLSKIDSLSTFLAQTTVHQAEFFNKTTDTIGTTIFNQMDKLVNSAEAGLDWMTDKMQSLANGVTEAKSKYIDRTVSPVTGWATEKLSSMSSSFTDDLHTFNQKVASSRVLNLPGDAFNSLRHIAFGIKGDLQKLVDFTHQMFAGLSATIIKLTRLIRKYIKIMTKILVNLIKSLIPTEFLTSIATSVNNLIGGLGETLSTFFNTVGLDVTSDTFQGLQDEVTGFAKDPLEYMFGTLDVSVSFNIPQLNKLNQIERDIMNSKFLTAIQEYSNKLTPEYFISQLPADARKTINVISQLANNPRGFVGNGVRSWARKSILKNKTQKFLGNAKGIGVRFALSEPYHGISNSTIRTPAPYIVFKKLITDNSGNQNGIAVDSKGNKLNYLAYSQARLF